MGTHAMTSDFLIVGAGSAGCVMASELIRRQAGSVCVLEAGPSERHPLVSIPFGLVWLMGSTRDWRFKTVPQRNAGNREINIPRGKMVGGSGSINSMVWFRGRMADFDSWDIDGWRGTDVSPAFDALEAAIKPKRFDRAHPLSQAVQGMIGANTPSPDCESSGLFQHNMTRNKRHSSATAYLRRTKHVKILTGAHVDRLIWAGDRAAGVVLVDGRELRANKGVVLCAGSVASPAILMRSGLGDQSDLAALNIDARFDMPEIGQNLHDHPRHWPTFPGARDRPWIGSAAMGQMGAEPFELCVVWTRSTRLINMRGGRIFQCPWGQRDTRRSNPFHPVLSGVIRITLSDEIRLFHGRLFVSPQITRIAAPVFGKCECSAVY
jgi:choline dehydrogenase-like flavoprotein